jgi:hypothetical protein
LLDGANVAGETAAANFSAEERLLGCRNICGQGVQSSGGLWRREFEMYKFHRSVYLSFASLFVNNLENKETLQILHNSTNPLQNILQIRRQLGHNSL